MSNLKAFLKPVQSTDPVEVMISKRFVGEDGKPVPFKIRPLSQEENDSITKHCLRRTRVNGQMVERLDNVAYSRRLVVAATVEPDFQGEDICKAYGTMDPLEVPGKMLLAGEYSRLSKEIMTLSGFEADLEGEVKN
ncbi:MAG: phage portal protein [Oscillospiraceae bacterium]|nr:phage portal protein [Oscillospiraceae bacterium]